MRILFPLATWLCLAAAPAGAQAPAAAAETISGTAVALDGDTLLVAGQRLRLFGVDAPEMREWPRGAYARAALDDLLDGGPVTCEVLDTDRRQRPVARCGTAAEADLGAALIAAGWAVPYRLYTHGEFAPAGLAAAYDAAERAAREGGRGVWKDFTK